MNVATFFGRLARDPELRTTQSGTNVCNFSIAVDRSFKKEGQPTADFFNMTSFGKRAEVMAKYFKKGDQIVVSGSLQNSEYTDKNGNKRTNTQLIVNEFSFVSSNNKTTTNSAQNSSNEPADIDFEAIDESDVPF